MCGFVRDEKTNELIEEFVLQGNDSRDWAPCPATRGTEEVDKRQQQLESARARLDALPAEGD